MKEFELEVFAALIIQPQENNYSKLLQLDPPEAKNSLIYCVGRYFHDAKLIFKDNYWGDLNSGWLDETMLAQEIKNLKDIVKEQKALDGVIFYQKINDNQLYKVDLKSMQTTCEGEVDFLLNVNQNDILNSNVSKQTVKGWNKQISKHIENNPSYYKNRILNFIHDNTPESFEDWLKNNGYKKKFNEKEVLEFLIPWLSRTKIYKADYKSSVEDKNKYLEIFFKNYRPSQKIIQSLSMVLNRERVGLTYPLPEFPRLFLSWMTFQQFSNDFLFDYNLNMDSKSQHSKYEKQLMKELFAKSPEDVMAQVAKMFKKLSNIVTNNTDNSFFTKEIVENIVYYGKTYNEESYLSLRSVFKSNEHSENKRVLSLFDQIEKERVQDFLKENIKSNVPGIKSSRF